MTYGIGGMRQSISRWVDQVFGCLPQSGLIVLDNLNNTSSSPVLLHILKTLIEFTPPHVRFIIISRTKPKLEIAKLHAKKTVAEINGRDLKFSDGEVHELFGSVFGMPVAQSEAVLINRTAEGWPAGLVLMHEYFAAAPERGVAALYGRKPNGLHTHVFDYLAQEVFSSLPANMQRFLLHTSIADYLPTPLMVQLAAFSCGNASAKTCAAAMLEELQSKNLFITILDDDATVIRYHSLFREFLLKKLSTVAKPAEIRKLYTIAAQYFKQAGDQVRAINLYLASGQFAKAVRQIEASAPELISRGQTKTLLRWIDLLPVGYGNRPWFLFSQAVAHRFTDPRTALDFFDRAFAGFRAKDRLRKNTFEQMLCLSGIVEACFYSGGNFKRMERAAGTAMSLIKQTGRRAPVMRARLLLALGSAAFFIGRLRQGSDALFKALDLFKKTGDFFYQIHSAIYLAPCSIYQGDFNRAREAIRKGADALASIPDEKGGEAALSMARAMTALFEGKFAEAQDCIKSCHDLAREYDLEAFDFLSLNIGGWLKTAIGDYKQAETLLRECKRKGMEHENIFFTTSAAHLLAVNHLHRGNLEKAAAEADYAMSIRKRAGSKLFYAVSLSVSGAIKLKQGNVAAAERELLHALSIFRRIGAAQQEANVHLLLAQLCLRRKEEQGAKEALRCGFQFGEERGFTYYYLLKSEELANLARIALGWDIGIEYCTALIRQLDREQSATELRVHCLGGFRIYRGQTQIGDVHWKSKRAKTLLKLLVAQEGQKLPREQAMEVLWPGKKSENLRVMFNSMLHRVRKTLGPCPPPGKDIFCIHQEGDLIALNSDRIWTDVGQILTHFGRLAQLKSTINPAELLIEYERTVSLYGGDFLPDDLYSDWATEVRDRLRSQYLRILDEAGALADSLRDKVRALHFYEKLFLADPCSERSCRWLMIHHLSGGQRGEAIRTYERCERALSRDLDLEPEEKTRKLYRSIIGG